MLVDRLQPRYFLTVSASTRRACRTDAPIVVMPKLPRLLPAVPSALLLDLE